jgi:hypothetical protein
LTASTASTTVTQQLTVTVVDTPPPVFGTGRTFYVSPSGSDSNSALSPGSPWQTIAKVNGTALLPGDTVLFQRGNEWHESLAAPSSGTAGNPISFADYGTGAKPKFWGSNVLTNSLFAPAGNGIYTYSISTPVTAALVNHTFFLTSPTGNAADLVNSWSYTGTTLTINSPSSDPRVNGYVYTAVVRQDAIFSNYMSHLVFRNLVVDETAAANQGYGIRIQNSTDVLVDSCEAYRAGKHHIASINSTQFVGTNLYSAWAMPGQSRVGASSIDPAVSAYVAYGDASVSLPNQTSVWRNCVWDHAIDPQNPLNYYAFFTHGAKVTSVLLDNMSSLGANLTVNNTDNPSADISVKGGLVQNARLEAYGQSTLVDGMLITGANASLRMGGTDSTFQNMLIEGSYLEADGYQTAAVSLASGNTLRFSTIVLDSRAAQSYSCLTLDSDYSVASSQGAQFQYFANICVTPSAALKQWDPLSAAQDFAQAQYNLYSAGAVFVQAGAGGSFSYLTFSQWQAFGLDTASVQGDPLFVNAPLGNYNLQGGSPAIGAARLPVSVLTANPPIPTDQAGNPRLTGTVFDIGALAYQGTQAPTGWSISAVGGTPQSTIVNTEFRAALQAKVLDSGGNPVIGVAVTFSAPGGGAGASFSGSTTDTALTDSNGIATSAALIAGGQQGSYTVTAAVESVATPANFSLANTAVVIGGSLSGSGNSAATTDNLTAEGTADWVHWGDAVLNRKSGVTPQIASYTVVGSGSVLSYSNDPRALSWTDGTPTASGSNHNGVYINSLHNGFSFTAPADTNLRTLTVHVGGWLSGGTLTASLSDGSAAVYVDITTPASGQYDRNYALAYNAASTGQTLTVTWVATSGGGNVTLNGAALSLTGPSVSATAGTPQSTTVNTAFATALQATVSDAGGNPVSGATVTFAAPATGASAAFGQSATVTATTNAGGIATAPTLIANSQAGSYRVTASVTGVATQASFSLTNVAGSPASVTATAGTPQSATVGTTFSTALQATVKDGSGNYLSGVTVTFGAPPSGAGATFGGAAAVTTNGSGVATAPALTANGQAGGYTVTASVSGISTPASFSLTNLVGSPASVTATAGTPQSATVNAAFGIALQATVKDRGGNPVSGVTVTFAAPSSGASATFGGSATVTTNATGIATAPALTANGQAGSCAVTASVAGVTTPASFILTNLAGAPASVAATVGTPQSATVSAAFTTALQATVKDAGGNPLSGITVTFAAPASGPSANFGGTATVTTNTSGVATAPAMTANSQAGTYTVTASVSGVATPASFSLTNAPATSGGTGTLSGSGNSSAGTFNLTTEGTTDWVNWGVISGGPGLADRKRGVTARISNYTEIGSLVVGITGNDARTLTWSDGTPTVSGSNNVVVYVESGSGHPAEGFSFTVPADTTIRTLLVHAGGQSSGGTLTATLSDGSAAVYQDTTANQNGRWDRNYTITFGAASAGQTLTIRWVNATASGNVSLGGAALK